MLLSPEECKDYESIPVTIIKKQDKNGFISKMHYYAGMDQLAYKIFFEKEVSDDKFISEISLSITDQSGNILVNGLAGATGPDLFLNYIYCCSFSNHIREG